VDPDLLPLPSQPAGVPWPTDAWPRVDAPPGLDAVVDEVFADEDRYGTTYAVVVVQGGRLLLERYGGALPHFDRPPEPVEPQTPLLSWSMAKSVLHSAVGVLVGEGRLHLDEAPGVPGWDDDRSAITLDQLLQMRDGLRWDEDYVDAGVSDVIEMLFGAGQDDVAGYAEARPLAHEPGTVFNYSSGTSNVVAAVVGPPARVASSAHRATPSRMVTAARGAEQLCAAGAERSSIDSGEVDAGGGEAADHARPWSG